MNWVFDIINLIAVCGTFYLIFHLYKKNAELVLCIKIIEKELVIILADIGSHGNTLKSVDDFIDRMNKNMNEDINELREKVVRQENNLSKVDKDLKDNIRCVNNLIKEMNNLKSIRESFYDLRSKLKIQFLDFSKNNDEKNEEIISNIEEKSKKTSDAMFNLKKDLDGFNERFIKYDKKSTEIRMNLTEEILNQVKKVKHGNRLRKTK